MWNLKEEQKLRMTPRYLALCLEGWGEMRKEPSGRRTMSEVSIRRPGGGVRWPSEPI